MKDSSKKTDLIVHLINIVGSLRIDYPAIIVGLDDIGHVPFWFKQTRLLVKA
jgi:hypothetical protein